MVALPGPLGWANSSVRSPCDAATAVLTLLPTAPSAVAPFLDLLWTRPTWPSSTGGSWTCQFPYRTAPTCRDLRPRSVRLPHLVYGRVRSRRHRYPLTRFHRCLLLYGRPHGRHRSWRPRSLHVDAERTCPGPGRPPLRAPHKPRPSLDAWRRSTSDLRMAPSLDALCHMLDSSLLSLAGGP